MKKVVIVALLLSVVLLSAYVCEAGTWNAWYLNVPGYNADDSRVTDRFSWNGYTHLAVTWNNTLATASGIEMDPDGVPVAWYWADVYSTYYDLYFSYDGGVHWYHYGTFIY